MQTTLLRPMALAAIVLLSTGCSGKSTNAPAAPDMEFRQKQAATFKQEVQREAKETPLSGPLTLAAAIDLAIKHNLDHRIKLMEAAVAREQVSLARLSYLPEITASAGYSSRNNYSGAKSMSLLTGKESLEYSTSQEKQHTLSGLRASWDVIDFGMAYYTTKQKTDEVAIAEEQRRKNYVT